MIRAKTMPELLDKLEAHWNKYFNSEQGRADMQGLDGIRRQNREVEQRIREINSTRSGRNAGPLIGIVGAAGAGKDTVADHFIANFQFVRVGFADELKNIIGPMFDLIHDQMHKLELKETPDPRWAGPDGVWRTPREILQIVGTEGFRAADPNFWVKQGMKKIRRLRIAKGLSVVVPDVRFANEAQAIREEGGYIWRVLKEGGTTTLHSDHASELEQLDIESTVTLKARHGEIDKLLERATAALHGVVDPQAQTGLASKWYGDAGEGI